MQLNSLSLRAPYYHFACLRCRGAADEQSLSTPNGVARNRVQQSRAALDARPVRRAPERRPPRCRGSGRCSPACDGRTGADRRAGCRSLCRPAHLVPPKAVGAVGARLQVDHGHPTIHQPCILTRADVIARAAAARKSQSSMRWPSECKPRSSPASAGPRGSEGSARELNHAPRRRPRCLRDTPAAWRRTDAAALAGSGGERPPRPPHRSRGELLACAAGLVVGAGRLRQARIMAAPSPPICVGYHDEKSDGSWRRDRRPQLASRSSCAPPTAALRRSPCARPLTSDPGLPPCLLRGG